MDHIETYEFYVGNLQLQGISGILGRDWLSIHNPYINFKSNKIYFLESNCGQHCYSCKGNKLIFSSNNITAPMLEESSQCGLDSIIPSFISDDELYDEDICCVIVENQKQIKTDKITKIN